MKEFKGTKGEAVLYKPDHIGCINVSLDGHVGFGSFIEIWYHQFENGKIEAEANANLIVDAFKVRQQINCELSELLEQRNEMLAMLEELYEDVECWSDISSYGYGNKIEQLIKKVKDNGKCN